MRSPSVQYGSVLLQNMVSVPINWFWEITG